MTDPIAPWADTPACPKCKVVGLLAHVPPEDDHPKYDEDDDDDEIDPSEELAELNDSDDRTWLWCPSCADTIDAGAKAYRQAVKAEEWADRPDREQAWAEILRCREVDRVAAEHAARQIDLFDTTGKDKS